MRPLVISLLLGGCVYNYGALGGKSDTTGVIGGGGATGTGTGGVNGSGGTGTGGVTTGSGTGGVATGGANTGGTGGSGTGGIIATGGTLATGGSGGGTGGAGGDVGADPDLVLWYEFDEDSGIVANDSSLFAGGPRNGSLTTLGTGGAVAFSVPPQVGTHAITMTANLAVGGGFVIGPSLFDIAPGETTIATWVYLTANRDWQRVFDFGNSATVNMFLTTSEGSDVNNTLRFAITIAGSTMEQRIDTTTVLPLNSWHHLAVVLGAGAPYTGTVYVDAAAVGMNPAMTLHAADLGPTINNYLGKSQYPADPYFAGQLDDFRVYRRALTAAEILTLFGLR